MDQRNKELIGNTLTGISIIALLIAITLLVIDFSGSDEKRNSSKAPITLIPIGITSGILATALRAKPKA